MQIRKIALVAGIILLFAACEKEPFEYLMGAWTNVDSEATIFFNEEGIYSWSVPWPGMDPNGGTGFFSVSGDTLRIEEHTLTGNTLINYYLFTVDRKSLKLTTWKRKKLGTTAVKRVQKRDKSLRWVMKS